MQAAAIAYWLEHGGSKGDAMRAVGYSEAMALNPNRVFGSAGVRTLAEGTGAGEAAAIEAVKRNLEARRTNHATFPPYSPEKKLEYEQRTNELGEDHTEVVRGQQMTDADIRDYFTSINCEVYRIVHGEQMRHVYFYSHDSKAQLDAADKIFQLLGSYAPKKSEVKAQVGIFSLSDLRKKANEHGVTFIDEAGPVDPKIYDEPQHGTAS